MLLLAVPSQVQALDLGQLLTDTRAQPPVPTLTCQGQGVCAGSLVPSILVGTPGQVMVLHLVRNLVMMGGAGAKVLTPVTLPQANHQEWPGLQPSVVLAHRANPNHWLAFVRVGGVWWRADSARAAIVQEDPFQSQPGSLVLFLETSSPV